jgi:hypothetical protein
MTTIQTQQSHTVVGQSTDIDCPVPQLSPYDLTGIRTSGSAASAVDLAGWLRHLFGK